MSVNSSILHIVGSLHFCASYTEAVRVVILRLRGGRAAFLTLPPDARRSLLLQCIYTHWKNRDLYRWVQHHAVEPIPACLESYADPAEVA